jgi:ABC-type transport system involved in multi-copper enzyme maturation permease subunit
MEYVAILRARRILTWYAVIFGLLVALGLALAFKDGPPRIQMSHDANPMIPLDALIVGSLFAPVMLAAFFAVGLDAEHKTIAIAWTRPLARLSIAARYVAVAFLGMLAAWIFTVVVALLTLVILGLLQYVTPSHGSWAELPALAGVAVMWYGLVVFVSALLPGRGNAVAGGSWAYALIVPGLTQVPFPPLLHQVTVALNYLNPLTYLESSGGRRGDIVFAHGGATLAVAWTIGIACIAAGAYIWSKREVKA